MHDPQSRGQWMVGSAHIPPPAAAPPPPPPPASGAQPDAYRRREWAAALRWAAHRAAEPFGLVQDGDHDSTDLRDFADRIEAGGLTPWCETGPEPAPTSTETAQPAPAPTEGPRDAPRGSQSAEKRWRVGRSWGVTIVEETPGHPDRLIATAQTPADALHIVSALHTATRQTADQRKHVPDGDPAGEPSKSADGPGWDRATIDSICRDALGEPHPETDQVRALLADRDTLEHVAQRNRRHLADTLRLLEQAQRELNEAAFARDEARAQLVREREARVTWMRRTEDARTEVADLRAQLADARAQVCNCAPPGETWSEGTYVDPRDEVVNAARTWRAANKHGIYYEAREALFAAVDRYDQQEADRG